MSLKIKNLFLIMAAISFLTTIALTTSMYAYADSLNFVALNVIVNPNAHASSSNVPRVTDSPQVINTPNVVNGHSYFNTPHRVNNHVIITHHVFPTRHVIITHHLVNIHKVIPQPPPPPPNNPFNSRPSNVNPGVNIGP